MLLDREHPRALAATTPAVHDLAPLLSAPAASLGLGSLRHLRRVRGLRSRRQGPAETLRTGQLPRSGVISLAAPARAWVLAAGISLAALDVITLAAPGGIRLGAPARIS